MLGRRQTEHAELMSPSNKEVEEVAATDSGLACVSPVSLLPIGCASCSSHCLQWPLSYRITTNTALRSHHGV